MREGVPWCGRLLLGHAGAEPRWGPFLARRTSASTALVSTSAPIILEISWANAVTFDRSRMEATSRAVSRMASTRPSARSRSYLETTLPTTKRYSGTRRATSSRTAASPFLIRTSHGSSPSGSTAT